MNPERARIQADLRGLISGEVYCDDLNSQMYSTDASILQIKPLGVVHPKSVADVSEVVKYAAENHLPIHARGSGSNVVGGAIGSGLVVDFSVHMRRSVLDANHVRVQPGVVLANLNRQLARSGSMFGPDPSNRSVTTMGGVISMDSTGSHWMKYGSPRQKIRKLQVVLADGTIAELGPDATEHPATRRIGDQIEMVLARRQSMIDEHLPKTKTNHAGYNLVDLVQDGRLDLSRLIAGAEGTLALVTEATLEIQPVLQHRGVVLLFFDQLQAATKAGLDVIKKNVAACDLLDRRSLSIARSADPRFQRLVPQEAEAMLLVEIQADEAATLRQEVQSLADRMSRKKRLAFDARTTCAKQERDLYWKIVRRAIPMQFGMRGRTQALPFVEDIAVAPEKLPEFMKELHQILNDCEVTASLFAHVGQGIVHLRPQLNLRDAQDVRRMSQLTEKLFTAVLDRQGSISGSHGDGIIRTGYLRRQYGRLYDVFGEIKREFDPLNILNPGKIVDSPPLGVTENLRQLQVHQRLDASVDGDSTEGQQVAPVETKEKRQRKKRIDLPIIEPQLNWTPQQMMDAASQCNGCARCKTGSPDERMCPIFRLYPREDASPRAKANLMRDLLAGNIGQENLNSAEFKSVANMCVNCHQCRLECPARVDIPSLMVEAKAQHVAVNGLRMSEWLLTRLDVLYRFTGRMPHFTNWMIRNRTIRWVLDRLFGIAQARKLPRFSHRSFIKMATRRKLTQQSKSRERKVLYFVDAFANWNDVELAKATCAVLKHNGFDVFVPANQQVSGMSLISAGVLDRAKKIAAKNVELLAEGVRQGCHIVTSEPSAALALKHEYQRFLDDSDAQIVAENCTDISNFLWQLHQRGDLELDFSPLNYHVGYHLPCHQRALAEGVAGMSLIDLIPGMKVEQIEKGCSGMAGTYGLIRQNYRRSLRAGLGLINAVRAPQVVAGCTECSTCKIQMEQGTTKPTIHPVKILALAYGLMPELEDLFDRRSEPLVVS